MRRSRCTSFCADGVTLSHVFVTPECLCVAVVPADESLEVIFLIEAGDWNDMVAFPLTLALPVVIPRHTRLEGGFQVFPPLLARAA